MIELKDGMNFHNFNLDCMPREWFIRREMESSEAHINRICYSPVHYKEKLKFYTSGIKFSLSVLGFLRENGMSKEQLEDAIGCDISFRADYDWTLSEMERIEKYIRNYGK